MLEVAHHGVAATQLCGPAIPLVVVTDGAIPHHCQDEGEDPLVVTGGKAEREQGILTRVNPHQYDYSDSSKLGKRKRAKGEEEIIKWRTIRTCRLTSYYVIVLCNFITFY